MQMDLWVVAAATGAGYLAKYWKNVLGDKEGSSGVGSADSLPDNPESQALIRCAGDKTWPNGKFSRTETTDQFLNEAETSRSNGSMAIDVASASDDYMLDADISDIPEYQTWDMTATQASRISRKSLRSRRSQRLPLQYIKPRESLDSCLMAQMDRVHAGIEEYLRTPLLSPCTSTLRPFIVSDGRRLISGASGEFQNELDREAVLPKTGDEVVGIPHLPQLVATGNSKTKLSNDKYQMGKSSNANKSTQSYTRDGSSSGQALFCFGISIGVMSTLIANKMEVQKLKDRLRQSENLVEDLQEELEMKDSLTVKELANDGDSQDIHGSSCGHDNMMLTNQANTAAPISCADEESVTPEKLHAISKIEAELEAELERLELSMKGSMLQEKFSDAIEELDVSAELVHGELNADIFGGKSSSEPSPDRGSTPESVKFGVSPRELSLRLHEVIQSRLQDRIMELEAELAKSQKRIQHLESEKNSWREVSQSESSSNLGSPMARPIVMNLSGDALDAYNEVFSDLKKLNGFQDREDPCIQGDNLKQDVIPVNQARDDGSPNALDSRDDDDDDDDDLLLIKQIVEKAKQGSPAILRAQRSLIWSNFDKN